MRRRKIHAWGFEDESLDATEIAALEGAMADFGGEAGAVTPPPTLDELEFPAPRMAPPKALAHLCSTDKYDRAYHAYGLSFTEVVRAFARDYSNPPDVVAFRKTRPTCWRFWTGAAMLGWRRSPMAAAPVSSTACNRRPMAPARSALTWGG